MMLREFFSFQKILPYTKNSTVYQVVPDPKRVSSYVFAVGYGAHDNLFISTNNGASWSKKRLRGNDGYPSLCVAIDTGGNTTHSKRIYVGLGNANGTGGGILRINNVDSLRDTLHCLAGKPIVSIALNPKTTALSKVVYAGGLSGIYKSTDTGRTYA